MERATSRHRATKHTSLPRHGEVYPHGIISAHLRERLWDAINGRRAFGGFKHVLSAHDDERERRFVLQATRLRNRMRAWLREEGIVPPS